MNLSRWVTLLVERELQAMAVIVSFCQLLHRHNLLESMLMHNLNTQKAC